MRDNQKTKDVLLQEVETLRKRVAKLTQTEEVLCKSEGKYHSLVNNIPDVLWTTDSNGNTTFISPNIKKVYGYKPEDIYTQGDHLWLGRIHPDDVEQVKEVYKAFFEKGIPFDTEYRIKRKDGEWIWLHDRSIVTYEKDGVVYADGIFSDITEQKEREKDLKDSEERFRTLSGNIPGMIYRAKADWSAEFFSHSETTCCDYFVEDLKNGKIKWLDIIHPDDKQRVLDEGSELAKEPGTLIQEYRIFANDGSIRWVEDHKISTFTDEGKLVGVDGVVFDITERKLAEEALKESEERYKSLFLGAAEGIIVADAETKEYKYVNPVICKMLGYTEEELKQLSVHDIHTKEELPHSISEFEAMARGEKTFTSNIPCLRKDETIMYADINSALVLIDGRKCNVGFFTDITERKKAEQSLRESEERLRMALSSAQMGTWRWDPASNQDTRDASLNGILGLEAVESTQPVNDFLQRVHPEDRDMVDGELQCSLREHCTYVAEFRIIRPDGTVRWLRDQGKPLYDDNDHILCLTGAVVDITDRKRAEEALRESEENYRLLVENQTDMVVKFDTDGTLLFVSPSYCKTFDKSQDDLIGNRFIPLIHEEDRERVAELLKNVYKPPYTAYVEERALTKDGWRWQAWLNTAILNNKMKVEAVIGVGRDITERKKAEEEVLIERNKLKAMLGAMECGVTIRDLDYTLIYQNDYVTNFFGKHIGEKCYRVFEGIDKICDGCPVELAIKEGKTHTSERRVLLPSGEVSFWENTASPIRDADGNIISCLEIVRNITERKQAEEELNEYREKMARAEQLASVGALSAIMSHTLNDLLTVIQLSIQDAMEESKKTSRQSTITKYLKEGLRSVSEVSSTVHRLGKFASESSKDIISKVNLKAVAERTVKLLSESARRTKMSLHLEGMGELPPIYSNERGLEQLFFSLAENAIQAADGKKSHQLIISGAVKDKHIELRFTDDCGGIAKKILDKIYEPFFTTNPAGERTGLGLCIVERNVSGAGGNIRVESKAGKGTTFFVTLPLGKGERS